MSSLKTILMVDDNDLNRTVLLNILSENYSVLEAADGKAAIELLNEHTDEIAAVILDVVMPIMDGYEFLEMIHNDDRYHNLPVIVTMGNNEYADERKALSLGAWDFVSKPYDPEIIQFRLKNAIDRSELAALKQLKYVAEYDVLTGIYNKVKFFDVTREILDANREERFVFLRFDVDRFQLINSFFGTEEGDKLLKFIASCVRDTARNFTKFTYGRMESDIFCSCMPYTEAVIEKIVQESKIMLAEYNPIYDIVPSIGIYIIDDNTISIETMYNRSSLAAKTCKGNYVDYYAYYTESMSMALAREQRITNEMNFALENGQFHIYLQPKYNIQVNTLCGAEALVRWIHPKKGIISPDEFIPVFERNGFITKLDFYVWQQACQCLRRWIDQGETIYPISVNVSRVNLYNPKLAELLLNLVRQYQLEPALLNLELTESAYTDNPIAVGETIAQLQKYGFVIMMDDFGSGYSSLNILKDIAVDVLKIDMRFLSKAKIPGRGENIIASVVRMAKWLNIPVVTEGVETADQVEFLKSIGCDYVQGYYFARPMPAAEYEILCKRQNINLSPLDDQIAGRYQYDDLFAKNPEVSRLFIGDMQPSALYEFSEERIELIRVNSAYYVLFGQRDMQGDSDFLNVIDEEYHKALTEAFRSAVESGGIAACEYIRRRADGMPVWVHAELSYVTSVGGKNILTSVLRDITLEKEINRELQHYRMSLLSHKKDTHTLLIVDDVVTNRIILKQIFENQFKLLEAENGEAALEILAEKQDEIDLILLDSVMPKMDGKTFLMHKIKTPEFDSIPVIMITDDDTPERQIELLALGASDYIVKPFIPEVIVRRVRNVLGFNRHFKEMIQEYSTMSEQVKTDQMTGLLNRTSTEAMISQQLKLGSGIRVMMMLDIDNFKKINDTYGHMVGDKVICAVAKKLRDFFRQSDIVARMGGDEFAVFIDNVPSEKLMENKAWELCKAISDISISSEKVAVSCSVGIAVSSDANDTFETFYKNSDKALYIAKCSGKGSVSVFGKSTQDLLRKGIGDAEGILSEINDGIYICSEDTYEILYVNDFICSYMGVAKENAIGKKCYEMLMHRSSPCEFCSRSELTETHVRSRMFRLPDTSKHLLMRGKKINWNGIPSIFEIAVDMGQVENMHNYLEETCS